MKSRRPNFAPALLILAAGMGSRYGGLKQIDLVGHSGETVLDYSVYDALDAGFGKLVFVIRREFEREFREEVGRRFESEVVSGIVLLRTITTLCKPETAAADRR